MIVVIHQSAAWTSYYYYLIIQLLFNSIIIQFIINKFNCPTMGISLFPLLAEQIWFWHRKAARPNILFAKAAGKILTEVLKIIWIFALVRICWNLLIISVPGWSSQQAFWHALHRERWTSPNKIMNCLRCLRPFPKSQQKILKDEQWKSNITSSSETHNMHLLCQNAFKSFLHIRINVTNHALWFWANLWCIFKENYTPTSSNNTPIILECGEKSEGVWILFGTVFHFLIGLNLHTVHSEWNHMAHDDQQKKQHELLPCWSCCISGWCLMCEVHTITVDTWALSQLSKPCH